MLLQFLHSTFYLFLNDAQSLWQWKNNTMEKLSNIDNIIHIHSWNSKTINLMNIQNEYANLSFFIHLSLLRITV